MKIAQKPVEIYGKPVEVKVDSYIEPDGWKLGQRLTEGDDFSSFRIPTGYDFGITSLAVEVRVTGRTWQRRAGEYWVRVEIIFLKDGDGPDIVHHGWMIKDWLNS